ncbi:ABC transporter substrate-binding protein [Halomonas stenophila]|uniref:Putative hydroxymethylpyrimidine transport system substrate-binding protein n=1 Tax=Halomonas stenophila TaxID=795312 RepID=A0A7W5HJW1_9GAMM|nr:ABC transporter substrate-binding protein [Halomonas stenophila]MBB3229856.1 putative hydroxymethylpyrimidine transport system substrate-binding protein [Halomonas stenophila]
MLSSSCRRPARALLLFVGGLLALAPPVAAQEADEAPSRFPPLDTEVMVPDLSRPAAPPGPDPLAAFHTLPNGPAVDTPTHPTAPAVAVGPAQPIAPPPVRRLEVMLDWYPSPRHAALFVARERDLFAHRGLEVEIVTPADPDVPTKLLAASRIDLAVTRQPLLHLLVHRGKPLVRVATLVGVPLTALVMRTDADFPSPSSLTGARIGHANRDGEAILLATLLASQDVAREEIDSPDLHFGMEQAMREARVDGVIDAGRHLLPRALADDGLATTTRPVEDFGVPRHDGLVLVANRDHLSRQRDAIRRFVDALEEATAWILEHPEESWPLLAAAEPTLDTPANRAAWPEIRARLSLAPAALSQSRYADFERFLFEAGLIDERLPVGRLAVDPGTRP